MSLRRISTHQRHGQSTKRAGDGIRDRNQMHDFYKPKTAQRPKIQEVMVDTGGPGVAPGVAAMELRCRRCLG